MKTGKKVLRLLSYKRGPLKGTEPTKNLAHAYMSKTGKASSLENEADQVLQVCICHPFVP